VTAVPVNQIICGDNVETLRTLPDACVDSCVTDPPYGLEFMGKAWDRGVPGVELWREVLRVLKPGGHLLAFAGTRTQHRMATAIEDAGFEIRDMIAWCYGSGFPKSLDVSKAIDAQDAAQEQQARRYQFTAWVRSTGVTSKQIDEATETNMGGHYTTAASQPAIMTREHLEACRHLLGEVPEWVERECDIRSIESQTLKNREVVGQPYRVPNAKTVNPHFIRVAEQRAEGPKEIVYSATAPATEAAKQWQGWGTALKPALEPITVARKPLCGTVAENVLQHGTGGLNVDGCRVRTEEDLTRLQSKTALFAQEQRPWKDRINLQNRQTVGSTTGRWPANLIHDGSDEVVGLFPEDGDASAARFFYCAKAGPDERRDSKHPTIKPVALMRYLVRLVTPPGGLVLDPFGGSGTTAEAARLEHCRFLLMELSAEYCADAAERLRQGVLF
jgi:site-specific DNA-methyltransferase (adenine-specific)